MKNVRSLFGTVLVICLVALPMFSCSDDDDDPKADKTVLNTLIEECETLADGATTEDYPPATITTFETVIATIKTASASSSVTQEQVDNMVEQLTTARNVFLAGAYDAIPVDALLMGLNFDEGTGDQLTTMGQRSWTAVLTAGPSQIFGATAAKPTFVDGVKGGKAMHFGFGGHLEIADYTQNDLMMNNMSIAVWVKPDSVRPGNYIASFNYWENWKFQLQEQSKVYFTIHTTAGYTDADNESDNSAPNKTWTHVALTLDLAASKLSLYVNGVLTKTWDNTGKGNLVAPLAPVYAPVAGGKLPFIIGAATTYAEASSWSWWTPGTKPSGWDHFVGSMDNFKLYKIALTDGQISKLYNDEKP